MALELFITSVLGFLFLFAHSARAQYDDWSLVSAPCNISYDTFPLGESGEKTHLFEWSGEKFAEAQSVSKGVGYVTNSQGLALSCEAVTEQNPWDEKAIVLNDGWNLVGNPFPYSAKIGTILSAHNMKALGPFYMIDDGGQYVSVNADTLIGDHEAFWASFDPSVTVTPSEPPGRPPRINPCGSEMLFKEYKDTGRVKSTKSQHGTVFTYVYNSWLEIYMDIATGKAYPDRYDYLYFDSPDELLSLLGLADKDFASTTIIGFTDWDFVTCYKSSWINGISYYKDRVEVEIIRYFYSHIACMALEEPGQYIAVPKIDVPVKFNIKEISTRQEYESENKLVDGKPACNFY